MAQVNALVVAQMMQGLMGKSVGADLALHLPKKGAAARDMIANAVALAAAVQDATEAYNAGEKPQPSAALPVKS